MNPLRIGLISDTHGLLRPEAVAFLRGSDRIVHAGDICDPGVLDALAALAPLTVVRGNNDQGAWADRLPEVACLAMGGVTLHVIHDLARFDRAGGALGPAGTHVVVSGHSHRPSIAERGGVLYVNPGSAGPRRFRLPVTVGELVIADGSVRARTAELQGLSTP